MLPYLLEPQALLDRLLREDEFPKDGTVEPQPGGGVVVIELKGILFSAIPQLGAAATATADQVAVAVANGLNNAQEFRKPMKSKRTALSFKDSRLQELHCRYERQSYREF
ncbi:hypothetical protein W97_07516 [Coniosporium apollinis CBS 100218]|uniref:Uncharacterized protein n=1 Tax=Coniosporium apollinis (strain CBS 100218) TaxID=1168221 RepID=R7Z2D7_CONA1|nr:uncharacterized protein W97_07516 [Coniosporium apollinis CBS 100218]EON68258.1 hypothetical protein W97_07516 [Coniosporium apollinis CBS 100218]